MEIKICQGYELEKERPNTSEDMFNRSEVTFIENGEEKTFHLLYLRYFDELFTDFTPFESDPIASFGGKEYNFRDVVALVALLKNPGYKTRKRVYINEEEVFKLLFDNVQWENINQLLMKLADGKTYKVETPIEIVS